MSDTTVTAAAPNAASPSTVAAPAKKKSSPIRALVFAIVFLGGAGFGIHYYLVHRFLESTDDAQIDGEIVSIPSRTSGVVTEVLFDENQEVKAGDPLVRIDDAPLRARLAQAEANLAAAKVSADEADVDERIAETNAKSNKSVAQASLAGANSSAVAQKDQIAAADAEAQEAKTNSDKVKTDLERTQGLFQAGAIAKSQLDNAQAAYDAAMSRLAQAQAQASSLRATTSQAWSRVEEANAKLQQSSQVDLFIQQARAKLERAKADVATAKASRDIAALDLSYAVVIAPADGVVSKKTVVIGQALQNGQGIGELIVAKAPWVTGNFKETQIEKMRPGQKAEIVIDAYPGMVFTGEVESFSGGTGAKFALLPPDNASGNFTKVVQRVPVRVKLTGQNARKLTLRPGLSVDLTIDTKN